MSLELFESFNICKNCNTSLFKKDIVSKSIRGFSVYRCPKCFISFEQIDDIEELRKDFERK